MPRTCSFGSVREAVDAHTDGGDGPWVRHGLLASMIRTVVRFVVVAALVTVLLQRLLLAVADEWWCDWPGPDSIPQAAALTTVAPGALLVARDLGTRDLMRPLSGRVPAVVALSSVFWALLLAIAAALLGRVAGNGRRPSPRWRPGLTLALAVLAIAVGVWSAEVRVADLLSYRACRAAMESIGPGATRADVRRTIARAPGAGGEVRDTDVFDPKAKAIDVLCWERQGDRRVKYRVHVDGDAVQRVGRWCRRSGPCDDHVVWMACPEAGP